MYPGNQVDVALVIQVHVAAQKPTQPRGLVLRRGL